MVKNTAADKREDVVDGFTSLSGWRRELASLGAVGCVFGLVLYLVVYLLPNMQKEFHLLIKEERTVFVEELKRQREQYHELATAVNRLADRLDKKKE